MILFFVSFFEISVNFGASLCTFILSWGFGLCTSVFLLNIFCSFFARLELRGTVIYLLPSFSENFSFNCLNWLLIRLKYFYLFCLFHQFSLTVLFSLSTFKIWEEWVRHANIFVFSFSFSICEILYCQEAKISRPNKVKKDEIRNIGLFDWVSG